MTAKMSFCLQAATTLQPYDLDAITDSIEVMAKAGLDMRDAERLAVESALAKARQDRVETAAAVREQHADLYVPKKAKAPSIASAASQFFTMPDDYIEPPRQARRISQGRPSIEDPIVPESKGFEGAMNGDLAVVPALGAIKSKPVRLPVGAAYGPHKGFGMEHIKDNAERNRMRAPPGVTPDAAENFARHVVGLLRSGVEIYQDSNGDVIVRDGRVKQAVVLEDRGGHYSVKTVRPSQDPMIWGQMIGRKRLSPPIGELLAPGRATAYKFDMTGPEVRMAPMGSPSVSIKPRRQFEMPVRQARATKAEKEAKRAEEQIASPEFKRWFGEGNTMANPDGTPMELYHGTSKKAGKFEFFRRSAYGAMGAAVYLGDSAEASAGYDGGVMMKVYARGKYLTNAKWSEYVRKHGWKEAEVEAAKDGWAGVYDQKFESAVAVWNPENIKSATDNTGAFSEGPFIRQSRRPGFYFDAEKSLLYKERTAEDAKAISKKASDKALQGDATARRIMDKKVVVADGEMVGARLNINVLKSTGVPVTTIHRGKKGEGYKENRGFWGGEVIGYAPVVSLKGAYFNVHQPTRDKIASGVASKSPMASVDGAFVDTQDHNFNGVEFHFNPKREHLFVDELGRAFKHADEVTLSGMSVYARGKIEYYGEEDVPEKAGDAPSRARLMDPGGLDPRQSRIRSEDQERQLQWLGERANQLGFGSVDDLIDKDFDEFMALAERWREENPYNPNARAVEPAPMYASYPVENSEDIVAWAEEQGIRDIIPPEKMHVTVAYSRASVDSRDLPPAPAASVEDGGRSVEILGSDIVLMVQSPDLTARWAAIKEAGASWDFEDETPAYKPHVTIAYGAEGADVSDVAPYDGPIELGEEAIEDLKSGWGAALKQSRPAAGYSLPGFGNGSLFIEAIQDRYNRWKQVIKAVRNQGGIINEANDFYKAEERYWGKVGSKIEDFDAEVQTFLEGLVKDKVDTRSMQLYAYAKHAKERNAQLRTMREANPNTGFDSWSGMTDELADQILADAHQSGLAPVFEKHHAELMKWTQGTRDIMLRDGLITQDQYDALQNSYDFYVPLKGKPGGDSKLTPGTGSGFNVRGKETERARGRYSEANDIIENIIADRVKALTRAGKNEVMRTFLKFVLDNPDPSNWQINETAVKPVMKIDDQGNQYIEEERQILKGQDTVGIKDGGREVFVRIKDDKLVEQMRNMNHQDVGAFTGLLLMGNRMLSRLYTSLSPVFTVLNFARDVTAGTIGMVGETGFSGAARMLAYWPKAMYESSMAEAGRPGSNYQLFRATGGKTGFMDFKTIEDLAKDLSNRVRDADRSSLDPRKVGPKALSLIEGINGAIENSTRLASFMAARDSGKTVAEAGSIAKNITVNFNRKGTMTNNLAAWFLFFNPAVQGTARVMQALKSTKVLATLGAGMSGLAMLAMQNALAGDDDDGVAWWDKIPEEIKDRNIVIVLPPGSKQGESVPGSKVGRYVKIPMPYGYNFFATVARLAVDRYRNELDPARGATTAAAAKRAASSMLNAYLPASELTRSFETPKALALAAIPDVLNAPFQSLLNVNAFGRPMYPERGRTDENIADASKFFAGQAGTIFQRAAGRLNEATGGSEFQSGFLDFTPATLENLARSYGGGPVSFALDLANTVYARQSIERPDIDVRRSPFIKQLYGEIDAETDRQAGFQRLDKIHEVLDPIAAAKSAKRGDLAAAMREEAGPIGTLGGTLKAVNKQLTALRKQELRIISGDESDSQKYAQLMELSQRKREVFHRLNRAYDEALRQPVPKTTPAQELATEP